ncbi:hypothetical protein, partial [Lonsdalea quercina]
KSQKPKAKSQKPKAKSQKPKAKSQKPKAKSQKPYGAAGELSGRTHLTIDNDSGSFSYFRREADIPLRV